MGWSPEPGRGKDGLSSESSGRSRAFWPPESRGRKCLLFLAAWFCDNSLWQPQEANICGKPDLGLCPQPEPPDSPVASEVFQVASAHPFVNSMAHAEALVTSDALARPTASRRPLAPCGTMPCCHLLLHLLR